MSASVQPRRYQHGLAGKSTLPLDAQAAVEALLKLRYGESYVLRRLKPDYPSLTREKVRTIRLRLEGRTHHGASVQEHRTDVIKAPSVAREVMIERALRHVWDCTLDHAACTNPDHDMARSFVGERASA